MTLYFLWHWFWYIQSNFITYTITATGNTSENTFLQKSQILKNWLNNNKNIFDVWFDFSFIQIFSSNIGVNFVLMRIMRQRIFSGFFLLEVLFWRKHERTYLAKSYLEFKIPIMMIFLFILLSCFHEKKLTAEIYPTEWFNWSFLGILCFHFGFLSSSYTHVRN